MFSSSFDFENFGYKLRDKIRDRTRHFSENIKRHLTSNNLIKQTVCTCTFYIFVKEKIRLSCQRECRRPPSQVHELVDEVRLVEVGGERAELLVRRDVAARGRLAQLALLFRETLSVEDNLTRYIAVFAHQNGDSSRGQWPQSWVTFLVFGRPANHPIPALNFSPIFGFTFKHPALGALHRLQTGVAQCNTTTPATAAGV